MLGAFRHARPRGLATSRWHTLTTCASVRPPCPARLLCSRSAHARPTSATAVSVATARSAEAAGSALQHFPSRLALARPAGNCSLLPMRCRPQRHAMQHPRGALCSTSRHGWICSVAHGHDPQLTLASPGLLMAQRACSPAAFLRLPLQPPPHDAPATRHLLAGSSMLCSNAAAIAQHDFDLGLCLLRKEPSASAWA